MNERIDALRRLQADHGLGDMHLVELSDDGFAIAHSDAERAEQEGGGTPLTECSLHVWLLRRPPLQPGIYVCTPREYVPGTEGGERHPNDPGFDFTPFTAGGDVPKVQKVMALTVSPPTWHSSHVDHLPEGLTVADIRIEITGRVEFGARDLTAAIERTVHGLLRRANRQTGDAP